MKRIVKKHWLKFVTGALILLLIILYINRERIASNEMTKTKLEIFEALYDKDLDKAKRVLDSFLLK